MTINTISYSMIRNNAENTKDLSHALDSILNNVTVLSSVDSLDALEYLETSVGKIDSLLHNLIEERSALLGAVKQELTLKHEKELKEAEAKKLEAIISAANGNNNDNKEKEKVRQMEFDKDTCIVFSNEKIKFVLPKVDYVRTAEDILNLDEIRNMYTPFTRGTRTDLHRTAEEMVGILRGLPVEFSPNFVQELALELGLIKHIKEDSNASYIFYNLARYPKFSDHLEKVGRSRFVFI